MCVYSLPGSHTTVPAAQVPPAGLEAAIPAPQAQCREAEESSSGSRLFLLSNLPLSYFWVNASLPKTGPLGQEEEGTSIGEDNLVYPKRASKCPPDLSPGSQ